MLTYFDSVIVIYLLDSIGPFQQRATSYLAAHLSTSEQVGITDLTRLECRVKPMRDGNSISLARFDGFFNRPYVRLLPLTTVVYDRATIIRAQFGFKAMDAIHLAAAVESGCDRFLTNDARLKQFTDVPVLLLP